MKKYFVFFFLLLLLVEISTQANTKLYGFGENYSCQLTREEDQCLNALEPRSLEASINSLNIQQVSVGWKHVLALSKVTTTVSHVYSWGRNHEGECGFQTGNPIAGPTKIDVLDDKNVVDIQAREKNSYALTQSGDLWVWGSNGNAALGLGGSGIVRTPTKSPLANIKKLFCFYNRACLAITNNNQVYGWGRNAERSIFGETGVIESPILLNDFTNLMPLEKVTQTTDTTYILRQNGELYCMGANNRRQCAYGSNSPNLITTPLRMSLAEFIVDIYPGRFSLFAKTNLGDWYYFGQELNNEFSTHPLATNQVRNPQKHPSLRGGFFSETYSTSHSLYYNESGVYVTGSNDDGYLGLGHNNPVEEYEKLVINDMQGDGHIVQAEIGNGFTILLSGKQCKPGGTFDASSGNCQCHSGYTGTYCKQASCASNCNDRGVCIGPNLCRCSEGYYGNECQHIKVALKRIAWGNGAECRLASGFITSDSLCQTQDIPRYFPYSTFYDFDYKSLHCSRHCLMINSLDRKIIYSWGKNDRNQLGHGYFNSFNANAPVQTWSRAFHAIIDKPIRKVCAAHDATVLLAEDGTVYCVGNNGNGICATNDGIDVRPDPIQIEALNDIAMIECNRHCVAVSGQHRFFSWGRNNHGQIMTSTEEEVVGSVVSLPANFWKLEHWGSVIQIVLTAESTFILSDKGHLFGAGRELGLGAVSTGPRLMPLVPTNVVEISGSSLHVSAKTMGGMLYVFGSPTFFIEDAFSRYPFLVTDKGGHIVNDLSTMLYYNDTTVMCAGRNNIHQCGLGPDFDTYVPTFTKIDSPHFNQKISMAIAGHESFHLFVGETYCEYGTISVVSGQCTCYNGYYGPRCEQYVCSEPCQNSGKCIGPNVCDCKGTGYVGSRCQTKSYPIISWGRNDDCKLGIAGECTLHIFSPQVLDIEGVYDVVPLRTSTIFTCHEDMFYGAGYFDSHSSSIGNTNMNSNGEIRILSQFRLQNFTRIFGYERSVYAINSENILYGHGRNDFGELGLGNTLTTPFPSENGLTNITFAKCKNHRCFFQANQGKWFVVGRNDNGELCLNHKDNVITPQELGFNFANNIKSIAMSRLATLILLKNGEIYGCGRNDFSLLSDVPGVEESLLPMRLPHIPSNVQIVEIADFDFSVFAKTKLGEWVVFGRNTDGQLGLGHRLVVSPMIHPILRGGYIYEHDRLTFWISPEGKLFSSGRGHNGLSGHGNNDDTDTFQAIQALQDYEIRNIRIGNLHSMFALTGRFCEHGTLDMSSNTCQCENGWFGDHCNYTTCQNNCNGAGECLYPDICKCSEGFWGEFCQYSFTLFGIDDLFTATYFKSQSSGWNLNNDQIIFNQVVETKKELIDKKWPNNLEEFWAIRYEGTIIAPIPNIEYKFVARFAEGVRVYVDNNLIINQWNRGHDRFEESNPISLPDHGVQIKVELFVRARYNYVVLQLFWKCQHFDYTLIGLHPVTYYHLFQFNLLKSEIFNPLCTSHYCSAASLFSHATSITELCNTNMLECDSTSQGEYSYTYVKNLHLSAIGLQGILDRTFRNFCFWRLKSFNMSHNNIVNVGEMNNNFVDLGLIETIDISYNSISNSIADFSLGHLPHFQKLDARFNNIFGFVVDEQQIQKHRTVYWFDHNLIFCQSVIQFEPAGCVNFSVDYFDPPYVSRFFDTSQIRVFWNHSAHMMSQTASNFFQLELRNQQGHIIENPETAISQRPNSNHRFLLSESDYGMGDYINFTLYYSFPGYQKVDAISFQYSMKRFTILQQISPWITNPLTTLTVRVFSSLDLRHLVHSKFYCGTVQTPPNPPQISLPDEFDGSYLDCVFSTSNAENQRIEVNLFHSDDDNTKFEQLSSNILKLYTYDFAIENPYALFAETKSFPVFEKGSTTLQLSIPDHAKNENVELATQDRSIIIPCNIDQANLRIVSCHKTVQIAYSPTHDIIMRILNLYVNGLMHQSTAHIVLFKPATIQEMNPAASTKKTHILFTLMQSGLNHEPGFQVVLSCQDIITSQFFEAEKINNQQILCLNVAPKLSVNGFYQHMKLRILIKTTASDVPYPFIEYQQGRSDFYFIQNGPINYNATSIRAGYVGQQNKVQILANTTIPSQLKQHIWCQLSKHENQFIPSTAISNDLYECNLISEHVGTQNISLWFRDPISGVFQIISSQNITFSFFEKCTLSKVTPWSALVGTKQIILHTNFNHAAVYNHVSLQFQCRYGAQEVSSAIMYIFDNEVQFHCAITALHPQIFDVTIWVNAQGTTINLSDQSAQFWFMTQIPLQHVYPFIMYLHAGSENTYSLEIKLIEENPLNTTKDLYCSFHSNEDLSEPFFVSKTSNLQQASSTISCALNHSEITNGTDVIHLKLLMKPEIDILSHDFVLSTSLKLATVRHPFIVNQWNEKENLDENILQTNFTLNFTIPETMKSTLSFKVAAVNYQQKDYHSIISIPLGDKWLECSFDQEFPVCKIPGTFKTEFNPSKTVMVLECQDSLSGQAIRLISNPIDIYSKTESINEFPFIGNRKIHLTSPILYEMQWNRSLNYEDFNFYYQVSDANGNLKLSALKPEGGNETFTVGGINSNHNENTKVIHLFTQINQKWIQLSFNGRYLDFIDSRIVPNSSPVKIQDTVGLKIYRNMSELVIRDRYHFQNYKIRATGGIEYPCNLNVANGTLQCTYSGFGENTLPYDIGTIIFDLMLGDKILKQISDPFLIYKQYGIVRISPQAVLKGTSTNVTIHFPKMATRVMLPSIPYQLYCQNETESEDIFEGNSNNGFTMSCFVPHQEGVSELVLHAFLMVPSITGSNPLQLSIHGGNFYYLEQGKLSVDPSHDKYIYLTTDFVTVTVALSSFVPDLVKPKVKCRLNSFELETKFVIFAESDGSFIFNCSGRINTEGSYNLTLWFVDDGAEYILSNNSASFSFFDPVLLHDVNPLAAIANPNRTVYQEIQLSTSLDSSKYFGNIFYHCIYFGTIENIIISNHTNTSAQLQENSKFSCNLTVPNEAQVVKISIWATIANTEKMHKLSTEDIEFIFVSNIFLTPSYGDRIGGANASIFEYDGQGTEMMFKNDTDISFTCYRVVHENNLPGLECTTPAIPQRIPSFSPHDVLLKNSDSFGNDTTLSMKYVIIEYVNMSRIHPLVTTSNKLNITVELDFELSLIAEGHLVIWAGNSQRYNLPQYRNNVKTLYQEINVEYGQFLMRLFFFHENLLIARNSILLSDTSFVLYSLKKGLITFIQPVRASYVNQDHIIRIKLDTSVPSHLQSFIRCKIGTEFMQTYRVTNDTSNKQYDCVLRSESAGAFDIQLYYNNSDALEGELLLSENALQWVFVEKMTVEDISPWGALIKEKNVELKSNFLHSLDYGSEFRFECNFQRNNGTGPAASTNASLVIKNANQAYFNCILDSSVSDLLHVSIWIIIKEATYLEISSNVILFEFMEKVSQRWVLPFAYPYNSTEHPLIAQIPISLSFQPNQFINNSRDLYCILLDQGETKHFPAFISSQDASKITCTIEKKSPVASSESITLSLAYLIDHSSLQSDLNINITRNKLSVFVFKIPVRIEITDDIMTNVDLSERDYVVPINFAKIEYLDHLSYDVQLTSSATSMTVSPQCTFNSSGTYCHINPTKDLSISSFPSIINGTIMVSDSLSSMVYKFHMIPFVYYEKVEILTLHPFFVRYRSLRPYSILSQLSLPVDVHRFDVNCKITSENSSIYRYSLSKQIEQEFYNCQVMSTQNAERAKYQLSFLHPYSHIEYIISSNEVSIQFIEDLPVQRPIGPITGGSPFSIHNLPSFPTSSHSFYQYNIYFLDRGRLLQIQNCTYDIGLNTINCTCPPLDNYVSNSLSLPISIYIRDELAITLSSRYHLYKTPELLVADPYQVPWEQIENKYITLVFSSFENFITRSNRFVGKYIAENIITNQKQEMGMHCTPSTPNSILCPPFKYHTYYHNETVNQDIIDAPFWVDLDISFDGYISHRYYNVVSVYLPLQFINDPSNTTDIAYHVYSEREQNITFIAENLQQGVKELSIRIYDQYLSLNANGLAKFRNSNTSITFEIPPLWHLNLPFPRIMKIDVSIDGKIFIPTEKKITVYEMERKISVEPLFISTNTIFNLKIYHVPPLPVSILDHQFILRSSQGDVMELECSRVGSTLSCNSTKIFEKNNVDHYVEMIFRDVNIDNGMTQISKTLYSHPLRTFHLELDSIYPSVIKMSVTKYISLRLKNELPSKNDLKNLKLKVRFAVKKPLQNIVSRSTLHSHYEVVSIGYCELIVMESNLLQMDITKLNLEIDSLIEINGISVNNGTSYQPLNGFEFSSIPSFRIDVRNSRSRENVIFSFEPTSIQIQFNDITALSNLNSNQTVSIRIRSLIFSKIYSMQKKDLHINLDEKWFNFTAPTMNMLLSSNSDLPQYPLQTFVGVSLNLGHDWIESSVRYFDSYELAPYVISVMPRMLPRGERTYFIIRALYLHPNSTCDFLFRGEVVATSSDSKLLDSFTLTCSIQHSISANEMDLVISTPTQISRTPTTLTLFNNLRVDHISPTRGISQGGYEIDVYGNFREGQRFPIYYRIGQQEAPTPCNYVNSTYIRCLMISHEAGRYQFALSLNRNNWEYNSNTYFNFTSCPEGTTSRRYDEPCMPCPKGTFKPDAGFYACILCPIGMYNDKISQTRCTNCMIHATTTMMGAADISECICQADYYQNYTYVEYESLPRTKCLSCPYGANCSSLNTIHPTASYGYWNYHFDNTTFFSCFPRESCPGNRPENCLDGYRGIRCGVCAENYYKYRRRCTECSPYAWVNIVILFVVLCIATLIFYTFSSIKVAHISSFSIATTFFQIVSLFSKMDLHWPSAVDSSFSVAAISNANFDFLTPECAIPMNFVTKWSLTIAAPLALLISFVIFFILANVRSWIASHIGKYIHPKKAESVDYDSDDDDENMKNSDGSKPKSNIKKRFNKLKTMAWMNCKRLYVSTRNSLIWFFFEGSTRTEMRKCLNKCIHSYLAFMSFSYIFLMSSASDIFVCTKQPNGIYSLDDSPDIMCYEGNWWLMFPFTMVIYVVFILGAIAFFIALYFKYEKWSKSTDFIQRFKFLLKKFKKRYFYWEFFITGRKLAVALLYVWFDPMMVVVMAIMITFVSLVLHLNFVPYKKKMHNIMEYIVLVCTLIVLILGMLFFVRLWPLVWMETLAVYLNMFIIVAGAVVVVCLILWDMNTRKKKHKKRAKVRRKLGLPEPEDSDDDSDISEDDQNINEIFEDLFSRRRLNRKTFLIKRKASRAANRVTTTLNKHKSKLYSITSNKTFAPTSLTEKSESGTSRATPDKTTRETLVTDIYKLQSMLDSSTLDGDIHGQSGDDDDDDGIRSDANVGIQSGGDGREEKARKKTLALLRLRNEDRKKMPSPSDDSEKHNH